MKQKNSAKENLLGKIKKLKEIKINKIKKLK